MISIYTLTNPETKQVYYVGFTAFSLKTRLTNHLFTANTKKTTASLLAKGLVPVIEKLDETNDKQEALALEEYWIHQFKSWGFVLDNMHKTKDRKYNKKGLSQKNQAPRFSRFSHNVERKSFYHRPSVYQGGVVALNKDEN